MAGSFFAKCLDCDFEYQYSPHILGCPNCRGSWSEARYDYKGIGASFPLKLENRSSDMWRYRELLPVYDYKPEYTMGEGGTPLNQATNLGMMLGCHNIYIKDERQGPTSSFKDRQAAVSIASLKESGIKEAVLASTGNVAIAFSAYAARAGIKLWAFLTSLVPVEKMREVAIYGTEVVKITTSYDQAKLIAAKFANQRGLYLERGSSTIPSLEAMKTIAFEITEQVTALKSSGIHLDTNPPMPWQVPDWYFQAVSGGMGPLGVLKGFYELKEMGLTDKVPAIANVQAEGCAPMVHAWKQGMEIAEPVFSPRTHIATLATGDPGRTYTLLNQRMRQGGGGIFELVSDEETFRTMHILAKLEGLSVEPAAAVAFAGLIKAAREGMIKPDDFVVVNCTGHTMPVEKMILGDRWGKNLVLPERYKSQTPEEGLLAALDQVSSRGYPRIAIVDDTPHARTLIRRILQTQGEYTFYEAENGLRAIEIAQRELPDLIILDLMMPEMDGFSVIDALKSDPETAAIPVIIVTAKDLSREEKNRLQNQSHSLMQKGEFLDDELLDQVRVLLNEV